MNKLFCMSLRTAGVVVGWLGLMSCSVAAIAFFSMLIFMNVTAEIDVEPNSATLEHSLKDFSKEKSKQTVIYSVYLGVAILQSIASGLLLLGTYKKRHLLFMPWLILGGIAIGGLCLATFVAFTALLNSRLKAEQFFIALVSLLTLTLTVYVFHAILALMKEIRNENARRQNPLMRTYAPAVPISNTTYTHYGPVLILNK